MEKIKYFEDIYNGFLLAYEESTEFFARYVSKIAEWEACKISFSNFRHDYDFREITEEEAFKKTNGNLPNNAYNRYIEMLYGNSNP